MTKDELLNELSHLSGISKRSADTFLATLAVVVTANLADGRKVTVPGLVKLTPKQRPARTSRNPRTGEPISVPAKAVVVAKPVTALSTRIAEGG